MPIKTEEARAEEFGYYPFEFRGEQFYLRLSVAGRNRVTIETCPVGKFSGLAARQIAHRILRWKDKPGFEDTLRWLFGELSMHIPLEGYARSTGGFLFDIEDGRRK